MIDYHTYAKYARSIATALIVLPLVVGCEATRSVPTSAPPSATPVPPAPTETPTPAPPTATPVPTALSLPPLSGSGGGWIAFVSTRDGNREVYAMNADGSDQRRLTDKSAWEGSPTWSPDGKQIAFMSQRGGNEDLYVMNADGTDVRQLTHDRADDYMPAWSPDGKHIAFVSVRDGNEEIYVLDVQPALQDEEAGVRRLTQTRRDVSDVRPAWSPDGKQIAFVSTRGSAREIYVMNSDGAEQGSDDVRRLTAPGDDKDAPAWSPDGKQLAFCAMRDGHWSVYVMNLDGTDRRQLAPAGSNADDYAPVWSPDGERLVFQSNRDGHWAIYGVNSDGAEQGSDDLRRLTTGDADDLEPTWVAGGASSAAVR